MLGATASDELIRAIGADYGIELGAIDAAAPLVHGLVVEGVVAARDAMAPVAAASGLAVRERPDGMALALPRVRQAVTVELDAVVAGDGPLLSRRRADPAAALGQVSLTYPDRERGYLTGTVTAAGFAGGASAAAQSGLVLDAAGARTAAERALMASSGDTLELTLPPSRFALEAGDVIALDGTPFEITEVRDGPARKIAARAVSETQVATVLSDRPAAAGEVTVARSIPLVEGLHLPPHPAEPNHSRLALAAWASPWPGEVSVTDEATGAEIAALKRAGWLGELTAVLAAGQGRYWDRLSAVDLVLYAGHLASAPEGAVLAGANRVAVEMDSGSWEVIAFAGAELVAPRTYRLTNLLRGQEGTDHAIGTAAIGSRVAVLNDRVGTQPVPTEWLGDSLELRAYGGRNDPTGVGLTLDLDNRSILPLSPVHLRATRAPGTNDVALSWIRRSRADANGWGVSDAPLEHTPEAYQLVIYNGVTAVRTLELTAASATYTGTQQVADFGALPASFSYTVAQRSAVHGTGHPASATFTA